MTIHFFLFLLAQAVSEIGSAAATAGLAAIWVGKGTPAELAWMLALPALPTLLAAPILGSLMERARLKRALLSINVGLGLTSAVMAWAVGLPNSQALLVLTGLFGLKALGQSAFNGAYSRAFGLLAPQGGLQGRSVAYQTIASGLGAAFGAWAGYKIGAGVGGVVFFVDAASFGLAAVIVSALPLRSSVAALPPADAQAATRLTPATLVGDVRVAIRYLTTSPRLMRVFGLYVPMTLVWSLWGVLGTYLYKEMGATKEAYADVEAAAQIGELIAAIWLWLTNAQFKAGMVMRAALMLSLGTALAGLVALQHQFSGVVLASVAIVGIRLATGVASNLAGGGVFALVVHAGPPAMKARLTALVQSLGLGAIFALSRIAVGSLDGVVGSKTTFVAVGFVATGLSFGLAAVEARARRRERTAMRWLRLQVVHTLAEAGNVVAAYRYYVEYIDK